MLLDGFFELNEVNYYRYAKAVNNVNECDMNIFSSLLDLNGEIDKLNENMAKLSKDSFKIISSATKDDVENFLEERQVFTQKYRVYKVVYENMDYFTYIDQKLGGELVEDKLTNIEQANIKFVESFYKTTVEDYYNSLNALKP